MRQFKNILAVYGDNVGANNVLVRAGKLAVKNNAKLTLIDVLSQDCKTSDGHIERSKRLKCIALTLEVEKVNSRSVVGMPFIKLIRTVLQDEHDLVIVGADSGATFKDLHFSRTVKYLMKKCSCPVWVVKPRLYGKVKKVFASVDPKLNLPGENGLDVKIMELSDVLTRSQQVELHIINAWDVEGRDRNIIPFEAKYKNFKDTMQQHKYVQKKRIHSPIHENILPRLGSNFHLPRLSIQ